MNFILVAEYWTGASYMLSMALYHWAIPSLLNSDTSDKRNWKVRLHFLPTIFPVIYNHCEKKCAFCNYFFVEEILGNPAIYNNMDKAVGHCVEWNMPDTERKILHSITYIQNLNGQPQRSRE